MVLPSGYYWQPSRTLFQKKEQKGGLKDNDLIVGESPFNFS